MKSEQNYLFTSSRISVVSVVAGSMVTLAVMFLFMSLAAALGFWSYNPEELSMLGPRFWTLTSIAWTFSVLAGSCVSAIASRSREMKNGILNSITAWAGSYLLFGGIALTMADSNLHALLDSPTVGLFWHGFLGDFFALVAGILGGVLGVFFERGEIKLKITKLPKNTQVLSTDVDKPKAAPTFSR
ncbi:MAG: hypothetical protein BroJett040_18230 [Oligoflexia bacterium]|nr:MAG: hypothetical protein BroJett040_18230 [Oligoflexia bacterium]